MRIDYLTELSEKDLYSIAKLFGVQLEMSMLSPAVFDKEDQILYQLLDKPESPVPAKCYPEWPPSNSACQDDEGEVCVDFGGGERRCQPLGWHQCFSGCE